MAGLHHHGGKNSDQRKQEESGISGYRIFSQIDSRFEGFKTLFHMVDTKEEESETSQYVTESFKVTGFLEYHNHAKYQHWHCIG